MITKHFIESPFTPAEFAFAAAVKDCRRFISASDLDFREVGLVVTALFTFGGCLVLEIHRVVADNEGSDVQLGECCCPPFFLLEVHFEVAAAALELNWRWRRVNEQKVPACRAEVISRHSEIIDWVCSDICNKGSCVSLRGSWFDQNGWKIRSY